ncbi:hypothetical protein BSM4216_1413 [Bacillus smithii]|nr:hypothetical protein BSM4216_1413 [Bacillus smithii]
MKTADHFSSIAKMERVQPFFRGRRQSPFGKDDLNKLQPF